MSLRSCGKRSGPKKVSFSLKIQLQFCAAECMLCASMLMSEEAFSSWTSKPWPLRPRPVPNTSVDMASQLVQHVRNALDDLYMGSFDSDLGSLMQKPAILTWRNEYQPPEWDYAFPQRPLQGDDPTSPSDSDGPSHPSDDDSGGMRSTSPGREPTPETSHPGAPWTALLYLRDQPAVRAQITSNDVEAQLAEIAELLNLPRHDLINTYRVNVVLPDLPSHITPLLHHIDDFVPGEEVCLCLVDVEIHSSWREPNEPTFPAIDRRVIVMPKRLSRFLILS